MKKEIEEIKYKLQMAVFNDKNYLNNKTLSALNDYINQLEKENQELKEDNLTYKHIIGDDLFFEDLVNKYKPCYGAMKILNDFVIVETLNNNYWLRLGNDPFVVISITKEQYEVIKQALESVEE